MILLLLPLLMIAFVFLSLSLSRHYSDVTDKRQHLPKNIALLFRLIGYSFFIAATVLSVNFWGVALGLVYWFGTATLVVLALSLILTFMPKWLSCVLFLFTE